MPFSIFAKNLFHKICQFCENSSRVEKYKGGQANLQVRKLQIRKFWVHSAIANPQISGVYRFATFVMINPQIANPQISLVTQYANRKASNLQG